MRIRTNRLGESPERETTSQELYLRRREFLRASALSAARSRPGRARSAPDGSVTDGEATPWRARS